MDMKLHNEMCLGEPVDANEISGNVKTQMMKLTRKRRDNEKK